MTPFAERKAVHIIALILIAVGVYATALSNGFVSDDTLQLVKNPLIRDWQRIPALFTQSVWAFQGATRDNYYRPVHFLVYMLVYSMFGAQPWAYHLLMLLLHAGATILVYLLARKLLNGGWQGALLAGVVFALHPIHTEAVLWIASVPDVVMTLTVLAAVYTFVACRARPSAAATAAIALLYMAGLLTKETGATLMPLLIGCELLLFRRRLRQLLANARFYAVLAAVSGAYLVLRHHALGALVPAQGVHFQMTPKELFFTATTVAGKYLYMLVLPLWLNAWHMIDPIGGPTLAWLGSLIACLATISAIGALRHGTSAMLGAAEAPDGRARLSFFLFLIVLPILPALNLNGIGASPFGERYLYLPSAGLALLAGEFWNWLLPSLAPDRRKVAWGLILLLLCAASVQILARIPDWRDDAAFVTRTLEQSPRSAWVHAQFGRMLFEKADFSGAERHYREALRLKPSADAHNTLGALFLTQQRYPEAIAEMQSALALDPRLARAHAGLGNALQLTGHMAEAVAEYNETLRLQPGNSGALTGLGIFEYNRNQKEQAIAFYRRAIQANGEYTAAHVALGVALVDVHQYQEALTELQRVLELEPRHAMLCEIHHNMGLAYRGLNMADPAIREFQTSARLCPAYEPPRQQLLEIQQILRNAALPVSAPRPAAR